MKIELTIGLVATIFVANTKSDTAVPILDALAPSVYAQIWSGTAKVMN